MASVLEEDQLKGRDQMKGCGYLIKINENIYWPKNKLKR